MIQNKNISDYIFDAKKRPFTFDSFMTVAAFVYPVTGIPQMMQVINGKTEGVSLLSWIGFSLFVGLFLSYSIRQRIKPMIITYTLWLAVDLAVVIGILINR